MQQLASYILAIHGYPSLVSIVSHSSKSHSYQDDDLTIHEVETLYHFDNGVVICQQTEQDQLMIEAVSDSVCEDYWINYRVIASSGIVISPQQKSFSNLCQQGFWLKMQRDRSSI
ncbi:hypothetical protein [Shewanella baltica]|uniref:hypothetical protein n=1 Tax=Shewanella baltica TaxID=62322 RepID=UPI00217D26F9|nr:hypothetical protein [Shewanella baltica]MCS6097184.1 hypothetical protein [Shewanella baltica]MCS6207099.1 hypothetical protein [Shewanella baltica]MCS6228201.1 hypothetical protein [Shewanella baltica]